MAYKLPEYAKRENEPNTRYVPNNAFYPQSGPQGRIFMQPQATPQVQQQAPAAEQPQESEPLDTNQSTLMRGPTQTHEISNESFLSKFLRPDQSEMDAANNGMRWHWALEHRPIFPGSKFEKTVMQGVDRENGWLSNMLRQQQQQQTTSAGTNMKPMASERQRSTMANQWNQFVNDIYNGHWDNYGRTFEEAMQHGEEFRQRYESLFGPGSAVDLRPIGTTAGKTSDLERKVNTDMREILYNTTNVTNKIQEWMRNGDFNDPTKSRLIKNELDKISQSLSATLGGDSKNMADNEKVRIQILYLPEQAHNAVVQTIQNYRNAMQAVMRSAAAKQMSQSEAGAFKEAQDALFGTQITGNEDKGTLGNVAAMLHGIIKNKLPELPTDLAANLNAIQNAYDDYMDKMVLAANVDPAVAYHMAQYIHDQVANRYNAEMDLINRPNDKWTNKINDVDLAKLSQSVPMDTLLTPLTFPAPALATRPGGKPSGNPQSKGEQNGGKQSSQQTYKTQVRGF